MKKIYTLLALVAFLFSVQAQTTKTMTYGGTTRQYLEYVPSSYNGGPAPVLFVLHGLGDDMNNMFTGTGFKQVADQHGWIVITPQALEASVSLMGQNISLGTAWNSGVSANLSFLGNIIVNDGVDDSGFIMAILDDLISTYNVDQANVFSMGFSMGGFMSNRLAIEHGDRINAIAAVSGTIGNEVKTHTPVANVNTLHFHGTSDSTVGYDNADFNVMVMSASVGLGAEATVDYWRNYNQCNATPTVTNFPNSANDGLTFEKYAYDNGNNGSKTHFIKVIGGDHTWYYTPNNDIDYTTEIYNFFASCLVGGNDIDDNDNNNVLIFPNPANNILSIQGEGISEVRLFNDLGQQVMTSTTSTLNVSALSQGLYTAQILFHDGQSMTSKVIISR
jgi:poly(3-hydroxybutyrate) depolymerase